MSAHGPHGLRGAHGFQMETAVALLGAPLGEGGGGADVVAVMCGAGQHVQRGIGAYENLRSQVAQKHATAMDVASQIQKRAMPQLAF